MTTNTPDGARAKASKLRLDIIAFLAELDHADAAKLEVNGKGSGFKPIAAVGTASLASSDEEAATRAWSEAAE